MKLLWVLSDPATAKCEGLADLFRPEGHWEDALQDSLSGKLEGIGTDSLAINLAEVDTLHAKHLGRARSTRFRLSCCDEVMVSQPVSTQSFGA